MKLFIDILGWIGSLELIAAYGLNSYGKIKSDSGIFLGLNVSGGIFLAVYSFYFGAFANSFLNIIWIVIAIPGIIKLVRSARLKN